MLIAWSDNEARGIHGFVTIPLNKANAHFWCSILHLVGEFGAFFGFLPLFVHIYPYNLK